MTRKRTMILSGVTVLATALPRKPDSDSTRPS
jgi:hypothetical protein